MLNRERKLLFLCLLIVLPGLLCGAAAAQGAKVPYATSPDWTSADHRVATGCGFGHINGDGWPDLVVANGNDIYRERVRVYYNQGNGTFPANPSWSSSDIDYHGHLSIGDVNDDGWLDVAVSVFLGPGSWQEGYAKLYLNNGSGALQSTPAWVSQDTFYTFSLALGDADGDGDLDLAVATGDSYSMSFDRNRIYYNTGGVLGNLPGWFATENGVSMDAAWEDMDNDGDLDLVFCTANGPMRIHYSVGGSIQNTAGWTASSPSSPSGNSLTLGDVNGDGYPDIVFSDNDQLSGGSGRFMAYLSDGFGGMASTPGWQSERIGYVSGVVLCDVQGDGWMDVIGGSWWGDVRVYLNDAGSLSTAADWDTSTYSVVEAIPLGDPDNEGVFQVTGETRPGDGSRKVFRLAETPVVSIDQILVDGSAISPSQYCHDAETGWVSLDTAPLTSISFDYESTTSIDFAVSNWDSSRGNYLFYRDDLTATLIPPANSSVQQGSFLPVTGVIANYTSAQHPVHLIAEVILPSSTVRQVGSWNLNLASNLIFSAGQNFNVPQAAPLGSYEFILIMEEGGSEIDRDSFPFQVITL